MASRKARQVQKKDQVQRPEPRQHQLQAIRGNIEKREDLLALRDSQEPAIRPGPAGGDPDQLRPDDAHDSDELSDSSSQSPPDSDQSRPDRDFRRLLGRRPRVDMALTGTDADQLEVVPLVIPRTDKARRGPDDAPGRSRARLSGPGAT